MAQPSREEKSFQYNALQNESGREKVSGFGGVKRYNPAIVAAYDPEIVKYTMIDIGTIRISGMEAIDTLAFAKKLKSAGMPEAQAEAFAEAVNEAFRGLMSQQKRG